MSLLEVEGSAAVYGHVRATHGISFAVEENEILALVGANGAGKSSTLKAIMGLVKLGAGQIRLDGQPLAGVPTHEIARRGVGFSPEGRRVFAATSVMENLLAGGHTLARSRLGDRLEQIFTYFPRLKERAAQMAGSLSGGEQQMLAIGRALMSRPRLLLLDEPSLGLAPVMVQRIGELIREIQQAEKLAVILAEQNSVWALRLASRGLVLEVGAVRMEGSAADLRANDYVRQAYLGA
jgi:branched-chain amino acid transport system ATP-binding protein